MPGLNLPFQVMGSLEACPEQGHTSPLPSVASLAEEPWSDLMELLFLHSGHMVWVEHKIIMTAGKQASMIPLIFHFLIFPTTVLELNWENCHCKRITPLISCQDCLPQPDWCWIFEDNTDINTQNRITAYRFFLHIHIGMSREPILRVPSQWHNSENVMILVWAWVSSE